MGNRENTSLQWEAREREGSYANEHQRLKMGLYFYSVAANWLTQSKAASSWWRESLRELSWRREEILSSTFILKWDWAAKCYFQHTVNFQWLICLSTWLCWSDPPQNRYTHSHPSNINDNYWPSPICPPFTLLLIKNELATSGHQDTPDDHR